MYRVGRRQFLTDLGRNTFAIAVLGGVAAACSGDDDASAPDPTSANPSPTDDVTSTVAAGGPPVPPGSAASSSEGAAGSDDGSSDGSAGDTTARWAQVGLGSVSAYVLVRGNDAAVVDTGNPGSTEAIGSALATLNATYDDVRHVILTHSHPDHIGSLAGVLESASGATPYAGAPDIPNISTTVEVVAVGDGDDVFGLQVIATPGHTPGSISVFDAGIGLLLAGDALTGGDDATSLSGPNERFTADMDVATASVTKLAALDVDAVGMGHGRPVDSGAGDLLDALAARL